MDKLQDILERVSEKVTPTRRQHAEIEKILKKVTAKTEEITRHMDIGYTIAGSFMRDTYMLDKREFDLFLMFPENTPREELEKKGLMLGKRIIKELRGSHVVAYAEHPYIRGKINGFDVDIVPAYSVKDASNIKSAVDRTPFHNRWLKKHLSKRLVTEVRLLKQFLKGQGLYGSDTKTEGFSGYLCELLIVDYKYFTKLLKNSGKWRPGEIMLNPGGHKMDSELTRKKFRNEPMIVIDPVDPNRNVASVVSSANFMKFVSASREFLEKPSADFFFPKHAVNLTKLDNIINSRGTEFLVVEFDAPKILPDILYPQLRRTAQRLFKFLKENEFSPMGWEVFSNGKSYIFMELEVWTLPKVRKLTGPPVFSKKHSKEFVSKYKSRGRVWTEGDIHVAEVKRIHITADDCLSQFLKDSKTGLKEKGVASYIAEAVNKNHKILDKKTLSTRAKKNPQLAQFLWNYLNREFY